MLYLSGVIASLQDGETGTEEEYTAAAKDEWIAEPYPSWTVIGTTELFDPNAFVEIKVTAYCPK